MSNMLAKVTLPSGNLAVYDAEQHRLGDPEAIRYYCRQIAVKFGDEWIRSSRMAQRVDSETARMLDDMPLTEPKTSEG